jgi:uncharacterized protein (TIGR02271 family)
MRELETGPRVIGEGGLTGVLLDPVPSLPGRNKNVRIGLSNGRVIEVPADILVQSSDGTYSMPLGPQHVPAETSAPAAAGESPDRVVPVLAEDLVIDKQPVQTGAVRVHRRVVEHEEAVELPLLKEHLDVRRVAIDREVDGPLPIRREGETTIIPIVEEVLVIEKRYRLKEEVHVSRTLREEIHREQVTVRRQEAEIERVDGYGRPVTAIPDLPPAEPPAPQPRRKPRRSILGED